MEKNLRDELAMSLPFDAIPTVSNQAGANALSDALGIGRLNIKGPVISQVEWTLKMQAAFRYAYADAMIAARSKKEWSIGKGFIPEP